MKDVVVYYSPSCAFSAGTIAFLALRGADFRLVNLDEHPRERVRVKDLLGGNLETPVIEANGRWEVAPSLHELKELLEWAGLPDQAAPHAKIREFAPPPPEPPAPEPTLEHQPVPS